MPAGAPAARWRCGHCADWSAATARSTPRAAQTAGKRTPCIAASSGVVASDPVLLPILRHAFVGRELRLMRVDVDLVGVDAHAQLSGAANVKRVSDARVTLSGGSLRAQWLRRDESDPGCAGATAVEK